MGLVCVCVCARASLWVMLFIIRGFSNLLPPLWGGENAGTLCALCSTCKTLCVTKANTTLQPHQVYVSSSALITVTHSWRACLMRNILTNCLPWWKCNPFLFAPPPFLRCSVIIDNPYIASIIDSLYLPAVQGLISGTLELRALSENMSKNMHLSRAAGGSQGRSYSSKKEPFSVPKPR